MDKEIVPCLSYPTTLIFVDDDPKFLNNISVMLGQAHALKQFSDPAAALKFLQKDYQFESFTTRLLTEVDEVPDHRIIDFNIRLIREEVFNPHRSNEISTVIIDYSMPHMTGGDLAAQLNGSPFNIILLTGEASAQTGIELFNKGIIYAYIRKDDPHFKNSLLDVIKKSQDHYFKNCSRGVLENFPDRNWPHDPIYKELFAKIRKENNIVEFYLLDEFGSYLFLNAEGDISFLIVCNEDMMNTYAIVIKDFSLPANIVAAINNKTLMPFLLNEEDFNLAPSEWLPYMQPVSVLTGLEKYYYSYLAKPDLNIYRFNDKITSFNEFLASQD